MRIVEGEQADCLRSRFIDAFINQEGEVYTQSISKPFACSDGMCYLGYLWDALKDPVLISEMEYCVVFLCKIVFMPCGISIPRTISIFPITGNIPRRAFCSSRQMNSGAYSIPCPKIFICSMTAFVGRTY